MTNGSGFFGFARGQSASITLPVLSHVSTLPSNAAHRRVPSCTRLKNELSPLVVGKSASSAALSVANSLRTSVGPGHLPSRKRYASSQYFGFSAPTATGGGGAGCGKFRSRIARRESRVVLRRLFALVNVADTDDEHAAVLAVQPEQPTAVPRPVVPRRRGPRGPYWVEQRLHRRVDPLPAVPLEQRAAGRRFRPELPGVILHDVRDRDLLLRDAQHVARLLVLRPYGGDGHAPLELRGTGPATGDEAVVIAAVAVRAEELARAGRQHRERVAEFGEYDAAAVDQADRQTARLHFLPNVRVPADLSF